MTEGFLGDPRTMQLFFRTCIRYKIKTVEARTELLRKLVARKKVRYLRDAEAFAKGKKILRIKRRDTDEDR